MPRPTSDRALRRLVAELAMLGDEDVEDILGQLNSSQRDAVESMLAELRGPYVQSDPTPPRIDLAGLSPWLSVRLGGPPARRGLFGRDRKIDAYGRAAQTDFRMTPPALDALKSCALAVQGPAATSQASAPRRLEGMAAALFGRGAPS